MHGQQWDECSCICTIYCLNLYDNLRNFHFGYNEAIHSRKILYINQTRRHPGILDGVIDVESLNKSASLDRQRFEVDTFAEFRTEGLVKHWRVHLGHLGTDVDTMSDDSTY